MAKSGRSVKEARLADELRANLARRKAQVRSRRAGEADARDEGIEAAEAGHAPEPSAKDSPE